MAEDYHLKQKTMRLVRRCEGNTDSLMLEPGFLQDVLQPVPLVAWVMVVAVPGLLVGGQVQPGVQGHQL